MTEPRKPVLEKVDLDSHVWRKLKRHLAAKRDALRRRNDNTELDAVQTAIVRGELRAIANLLALDTRPDPVTEADEGFGE